MKIIYQTCVKATNSLSSLLQDSQSEYCSIGTRLATVLMQHSSGNKVLAGLVGVFYSKKFRFMIAGLALEKWFGLGRNIGFIFDLSENSFRNFHECFFKFDLISLTNRDRFGSLTFSMFINNMPKTKKCLYLRP